MARPRAAVSTTGAHIYQPVTDSTSGGICARETTLEEWRVAATPRTHTLAAAVKQALLRQAASSVEAVGIEPTYTCLRVRPLANLGARFHFALAGSVPHGS